MRGQSRLCGMRCTQYDAEVSRLLLFQVTRLVPRRGHALRDGQARGPAPGHDQVHPVSAVRVVLRQPRVLRPGAAAAAAAVSAVTGMTAIRVRPARRRSGSASRGAGFRRQRGRCLTRAAPRASLTAACMLAVIPTGPPALRGGIPRAPQPQG